MSSGTQSSSSTYSPGKGVSFAKDVASRVVDAAVAAKDEKKLQQKIISEGGSVPDKDQKGLFVKALKQEFVSNPINDLKKQFNKKAGKVGRVAGLFGKRGEKIESKLGGGLFKIKEGFDRSGYKRAEKEKSEEGGGGSNGLLIKGLGELVIDIQQIASIVGSMQGLINSQMNLSSKMSESIGEIKTILSEQLDIQQKQIEHQKDAEREAALEASKDKSASGSAESTSTMGGGGGLGDLISNLFNVVGQIGELLETLGIGAEALTALGTAGLAGGAVVGTMGAASAIGQATRSWGDQLRHKNKQEKMDFLTNPLVMTGGAFLGPVGLALTPGITASLMTKNNLMIGSGMKKAAEDQINFSIDALARFLDLESGLASTIGAPIRAIWEFIISGGDMSKSNVEMSSQDANIRESFRKVFQGGGGTKGSWGTLGLYGRQGKLAGGGVMIGEAGPEAVMNLHGAEGKKMLGQQQDAGNTPMQDMQDNYFSAIAGSTLAVTRDFVRGLGPIGDTIAPVIQGKVSELGRDFNLPATTTRVSVGGSSLRSDPQAKRKGEEYLKQLVAGTLKKLFPDNKDKKKKKSSGSSDTGDNPTPTPTPTNGGKADMVIGDSVARGLAGNGATPGSSKDAQMVGRNSQQTLQYVKGLDKSKLEGKTIRLSSGILNSPNDLKSVEEQIKYLTAAGAKVQLVGTPTNNPKFSGLNTQLKQLADTYKIEFLGGYEAGKDKLHPSDYNKLNQQFNTPSTPPNVKAEKGISITSNGGGNKQLLPGKTYGISDLNPHHSDSGRTRVYKGMNIGEPKDYGMGVLPQYMPSGPNGKVPLPVPGKVLTKEWDRKTGYGRTVIVDTSLGKMQFSHMSKFGAFNVGDQLAAGTIVGVQGGSGNSGESSYAEHLHVNASKQGHEAFVNFITSGKPTTGALGDDGKTDSPGNEDSGNNEDDMTNDPIGAIEKAFTGMVTGLSLMGLGMQGKIKTKEDYDSAKTANKYDVSLSQPGAPKDNPPQGNGPAPKPAPGRAPTPAAASPTGGQSRTPTLATPSRAPSAPPSQLSGVGSTSDTTLKHGTKPVSTGTLFAPV